MYLAIIILPLQGLIVSGFFFPSGFIKRKFFNLLLSYFFYILLLYPFKVILPLLSLDYLFPIFSGLFACILTVATCFFDDKHNLFSFIQLLYMFIIACALAYFAYAFKQCEFLYLLFAFFPLFVEGNMNEGFVYLPSNLALFIEGNNNPSPPTSSPPTSSPFPGFNNSSSPSPSPSPIPNPFTSSFEQELWENRSRSLEDARRLDIAKRILLRKIIESKNNVPNEIEQLIQDRIWGNHWYDLYSRRHPTD